MIPVLAIILVFNSCYKDVYVDLEDTENPSVGTMSFKNDIMPIFNASCNISGCHNGQVAPNLLPDKAYNSLINGNYINTSNPQASELYQWMKGNRSQPMPLSGPNKTYNDKVLAWITQGALNN